MRTEQTGGREQTAWSEIDWTATEAAVKRLQGRIYRAAAAGKVVCHGVFVPALERNALRVKARSVVHGNNLLVALFSNDNAGVSP